MRAVSSVVVLGLAVIGAVQARAVDLQNHAVALSGRTDQYGPGFSAFGDNTFGQFGAATINNAGQVAFASSNSDYFSGQGAISTSSVFLFRPGVGLELVGRGEGNAAPFQVVGNPFLSADGSTVFYGFATGGNNGYQYHAAGGSTTNIAQVGGSANALVANASYSTLTTFGSFMYRGGNLGFGGTLTGTGVTGSNDDFLARSINGQTPALLARDGASGSNPFGTDNASRTWANNFTPMAVNANGDVAFLGGYTGGQFGEPTMFGKLKASTGDVTTYAVSGDAVPGPGSNGNYAFVQGSGRMDMNDNGDVVFLGRQSSGNPNLLIRNVNNTPQFLAKTGDTIGGVTITGFSASRDPIITGNTTIFFQANVGATGSFGIFKYTDGGGFQELLETGNAAKGPGGGLTFSDINQISANAKGDFVFHATLNGSGITGANDEALYAYRGGQLQLIVREGDLYDVDPTAGQDLRTIFAIASDTQLINTGGQDGRRGYINDNGDIVYSLIFQTAPSTFSAGVFITPGSVSAVPEPAAALVLAAGTTMLLTRRRRKH